VVEEDKDQVQEEDAQPVAEDDHQVVEEDPVHPTDLMVVAEEATSIPITI
jgi:hypothetical protein